MNWKEVLKEFGRAVVRNPRIWILAAIILLALTGIAYADDDPEPPPGSDPGIDPDPFGVSPGSGG